MGNGNTENSEKELPSEGRRGSIGSWLGRNWVLLFTVVVSTIAISVAIHIKELSASTDSSTPTELWKILLTALPLVLAGYLIFSRYLQPDTQQRLEHSFSKGLAELQEKYLDLAVAVEKASEKTDAVLESLRDDNASGKANSDDQHKRDIHLKVQDSSGDIYIQPDGKPERPIEKEKERFDVIQESEAHFAATINRLSLEIEALTKRGNVNLFLGIVVTLMGLGFLGYVVMELTPSNGDFTWDQLAAFVPRISLVVFVELFAYFFLRLYKASLAEIKYYQNELTNIELKKIALTTGINQGFEDTTQSVIHELKNTERNKTLEAGQTTAELERQRQKDETMMSMMEKLSGLLKKDK